jgi:hypothetical protein
MGRLEKAGVAFLITAALLACKKNDSGGSGSACSSDTDCKNGFLCESSACIPKEAAEKIRSAGSGASPTMPAATAPAEPTGGSAPAPAAAAADDGPVPAIPEGQSNPPVGDEWSGARAVNTQAKSSWPPDCTMKILREWLQVNCTGKILGYEKMENFGRPQVDYFESIDPPRIASFVVRLKKGKTLGLRICRDDARASLFVNWPGGKDRPVHVALGRGPGCDGSDWGAFHKKKPAAE